MIGDFENVHKVFNMNNIKTYDAGPDAVKM